MTRRHIAGRPTPRPPICKRIRAARIAAGFSQEELAAKVGVSQSMVNRWEHASEPSLSSIAAIERAVKLPKGDLLRAAGYVEETASVGHAIAEDPRLDSRARRALLALYRSLTKP